MPLTPVHTLEVVVADEDIDELEHANNVAYVRWMQDVAVSHSASVGLDFEAYRRIGGVFVVRRQEIDYLRPVLRGAKLVLRTWIDSALAAQCVRATEIVDAQGSTVLRAKTTWGYIDLARARPARIPQEIRDAFMFGAGDAR